MSDAARATEGLMRRLILSGRTVLSTADTHWRPGILERTGAEAGIDVAHVAFGDFHRTDPCFAWERRPYLPDSGEWHGVLSRSGLPGRPGRALDMGDGRPAGIGLPRASGRPLSGRDAMLLRGSGTGPWCDPRPVFDPVPALSGRGIVVVRSDNPAWPDYLHWLAVACADAARRDGRRAPVVIGSDPDRRDMLADRLGWPAVGPLPPHGYWIASPEDNPACGTTGGDAQAIWEARVAARRSAAVASRSGGVWTVRGEGRSVHAIRSGCGRAYLPSEPDRERVLVATVSAGTVSGHTVTVKRGLDDDAMAGIAMTTWESGMPCRDDPALGGLVVSCSGHPDILDDCRRDGGYMGGDEGAMAAAIAADLGPERADALGRLSRNVPIQALALWASGGAVPGRRLQFLSTFPVLATLGLDPEVTRLVDAGLPPLPRLCEVLGAPRASVRRFLTQPDLYHPLHSSLSHRVLGAILSTLDHGRLPPADGRMHWAALFEVVSRLLRMGSESPKHVPAAVRIACTLPGDTWPRRASALNAWERPGLAGARDMLRSLEAWIEALAGRYVGPMPIELAYLYGTLPRLREAARLWHADPVLTASSVGVPPDATWPVPFGTLALGEGWSATCLATSQGLRDEGGMGPDATGMAGLSHCVASYARRCLDGRSLIVSLRADTGQGPARVSTIELRPDREGGWRIGGRPHRLAQHLALRNAEPPAEAHAKAEALGAALAAGHPVDEAAFAPRDRPDGTAAREPALDLLPRWRPILPRAWRHLDAAGILAAVVDGAGMPPGRRAA